MDALTASLSRNRPLVLMLALAILILGGWAWRTIPIDAFPDATNQQVMILTEAEGLSPLDVERRVTFPIESVMGGLPHVRLVRSLSKTALSQVVVVFEDSVDTYFARQRVFEKLQEARSRLPEGVEPELGPISTGLGEALQYTLESDVHDAMELRTLHDWLVAPRLRAVSGVNEVNSFGGLVRQIHVLVDPDRLVKYGLTLEEVSEAVAENNANVGGGFLTQGWEQQNLRSVGLFESVEDIRAVVLRAEDGAPVFLKDVAETAIGHMARMGAVTRDGKGERVAGMAIMLKGENAREVVRRIKEELPGIERSLPSGVRFDVYYDRTDLVEGVVSTMRNALTIGGCLVVLVLFLTIGSVRAALVASFSLALTACVAFILMRGWGLPANLMSLGGLAVAIGMVVDGTIVVVENATRKLSKSGRTQSRKEVVFAALEEVRRPILFAILITAVVFLPMFSLEGVEGKMFFPLALTMIFAMAGSMLAGLIVSPVLFSFGPQSVTSVKESAWVLRLRDRYLSLLAYALDRRWVGWTAAALLVGSALVVGPRLGVEFLPELDEGAIAINVVRLPNASLEGTIKTADYLEKEILTFPEVRTVVSKSGRAEISEDPMGPEQTDLLIMLKPRDQWESGRDKAELIEAIRLKLAQVPGIRPAFSQPIALRVNELISGVKSDLAIKVFGESIPEMKEIADRIGSVLRTVEGASDVSIEQVTGFDRLEIVPDRKALARHKLNMNDINRLIETAVGGRTVTSMVDGQKRFDVVVRYPPDRRDDRESLSEILVPTPAGARIPLGQVAEIRSTEGPAQIGRENANRRVAVEANVSGRDLGGFVKEVQEKLEAIEASLPPGYWLDYGGTFENQQRAMKRLSIVVPLSIALIFVLLTIAFESVRNALLALAALPLALAGGVFAMWIAGVRLNVPSTVGFIALFGAATQNGMVLVSFIAQLRREGVELRQAVMQACSMRFRALLMTALTTIAGLAPLTVAIGPGSEMQRPLAIVIIGGMITATVLTLLILPTLYEAVHGSKGRADEPNP